jgi:hypothetical protein
MTRIYCFLGVVVVVVVVVVVSAVDYAADEYIHPDIAVAAVADIGDIGVVGVVRDTV